MTFKLRNWNPPPPQRYTKLRQRMMSNRDCARLLANRTYCLGSKVIHAGLLCGWKKIVVFVRFTCVAVEILGEIPDNAMNGSFLDTLVPKLKKLMMNEY